MIIKLSWIKIKNFKGIKDLVIMANGQNMSIRGNNARGKTTVMDSFRWLLFNKDSNDNTNFKVKPQDSRGMDIHHLQTEVEAELSLDGAPTRLKKMQEEKWTTRRGADAAELTGNTTSYWYDEVPTKAGEYKAKIDSLIDENIFKMITDPLYFNTKLRWEDRRKILLEISGDATDEQVIASDKSLHALTEILRGKKIDNYQLVISDQLKKYKKERDNLPPRIDELTLSLPQEELDYTEVETELKKHKDELATVEFLLTNAATKANKISEKYQELNKLKLQLEETKSRIKLEINADKQRLAGKHSELTTGIFLLKQNIQALESQIEGHTKSMTNAEQKLIELRSQWNDLNKRKAEIAAREFDANEIKDTCPTCNQKLPVGDIEQQIREMSKQFQRERLNELEKTNRLIDQNIEEGQSTKAKVKKYESEKELAEKELEDKEFQLENLKISIDAINEELSKPMQEPDYTKYPEITELSKKIDDLACELDKPVEDKTAELLQNKADIQAKIDECNKFLIGKTEVEKKKARIAELKADERRVSTKIAELEGHKFLLEKFAIAKADLLEDRINSQFKHVKFKLFEDNITNEGGKPTCIALVNTNGAYVPFVDANDGGKINAGIEVINSLSKFYEVQAPIFVDNAESVTDLAETEAQVIRLIKPEIRDEKDRKKYSQLVVEAE